MIKGDIARSIEKREDMMPTEKPEPSDDATSDAEHKQLKNQVPKAATGNEKPDEGLRPDQLTSENDGGVAG